MFDGINRRTMTDQKLIICNLIITLLMEYLALFYYLHNHDQPHQEGEKRQAQEEEFPPVLLAKQSWVHIHDGGHQTLHTHKLVERPQRVIKVSCLDVLFYEKFLFF